MGWAEARQREAQALQDSGAVMQGAGDGSEEKENQPVDSPSFDHHQLAAATLLLHQHTSFQVPASLEHLNEEQRAIYEELLAQWQESWLDVD